MSGIALISIVVGAFLVLYAAVSLARGGRQGNGKRAQSLGCGFTLLAGLVWGFALRSYLGSWGDGLRLGFGLAFVLPALASILHPHKRNLVGMAVLLTLAVILAGPVVPRAWERIHPSASGHVVQELDALDRDLTERIAATESYLAQLRDDRNRLRESVRDLGYATFEKLEDDPDAYAALKEYHEVRQLEAQAEERLKAFREKQERLASSLRRAERLLEAKETLGEEADLPDIAEIRREVEGTSAENEPLTVEKHVEREELRALFEDTAQ